MSNFTMMDWNSKWDWESFAGFCSKATESPKKVQLVDWTIVDDGEIDGGSINLSTGCGNTSASDGAHVSSSKSSLSASTDSSVKQPPNFKLTTFGGFSGTSPHLEASTGSVEPLIGLKLGKRTYFENCNVKSESFSVMPTPSTTLVKKTKSLGQNVSIPRCAVDRCNIDLSTAKEYHRKHRICDNHSKCAKVVVGGLERRFCQQCSRFHNLSEFDEKKRSCRRRLSDHNARRRKAQPETIHFNSARLSSPFYGERQPWSFLLNNSPLIHSRNSADTTWDNSTCNSKFTLTKGYRDGGTDEAMHVPGIKLPYVISRHANAQLLPSKSSIPEIFNPGSRGSVISSHLDAAHEYRRALSLLSKNTLDPCGPENMPLHHPTHENGTCVITQPTMHTIPEGVPLSSSELWLAGHKSPHPPLQSFVSNTNFQDIQLLATPYETDLYSSILN